MTDRPRAQQIAWYRSRAEVHGERARRCVLSGRFIDAWDWEIVVEAREAAHYAGLVIGLESLAPGDVAAALSDRGAAVGVHMSCEWNPAADRPAYDDERHADDRVAFSVGTKNNFHLCAGLRAIAAVPAHEKGAAKRGEARTESSDERRSNRTQSMAVQLLILRAEQVESERVEPVVGPRPHRLAAKADGRAGVGR